MDDPQHSERDWMSVLVLHQNRYGHTQNARNFIKAAYLPPFLDIVIWGHEHECIPTPFVSFLPRTRPACLVSARLVKSRGHVKGKNALPLLSESNSHI